ncbi:MAG: putative transport system permease protein [Bacteroidales bacterium]|nr:putative transport system permease protein [Bacteroidales bacterium]
MIKHYFKLSLRNLLKMPVITIIKVAGFSLALAVFIVLSKYVYNELNYDKFHTDYEKIFRVCSKMPGNNNEIVEYPVSGGTLAKELASRIPEVKYGTAFFKEDEKNIVVENKLYPIKDVLYIDTSFFNVFDFNVHSTDIEKIIDQPNMVIFTEELAVKLFGTADVVNNTILIDDKAFTIGAVCDKVPELSHFTFNLLISMSSVDRPDNNFIAQQGLSFYNYIKLTKPIDQDIEKKIVECGKNVLSAFFSDMGVDGMDVNIGLQEMAKIHLNSNMLHELGNNGNKKFVYINLILIFIILTVSAINYSSIFLIKSHYRSKEIAIRSILGANRNEIKILFICESLMITIIAVLLAIIIAFFIGPVFASLLNSPISVSLKSILYQIPVLIVMAAVIGIPAGLYSAMKLTRLTPVKLLRVGNPKIRNKVIRSFVVFQLTFSAIILINLIITNSQIQLMKNKDLGFNTNNIIVVDGLTENMRNSKNFLYEKMKEMNWITDVSYSQHIPGVDLSVQKVTSKLNEAGILVQEIRADGNIIDIFDFPFITAPSNISQLLKKNENILINEEALKQLDIKNPIGEKINIGYGEKKIIGVLKNFNFESLHNTIDPLMIHSGSMQAKYIVIKTNQLITQEISDKIRGIIHTVDPSFSGNIIPYTDILNSLYIQEERTSKIYRISALIIVAISLMGILALTSISILNKLKSIAIRKTFGAKSVNILTLLSKPFSYNLLIAFIIASPISYYIMNRWLLDFPYRKEISIQPFIVAFIILFTLTYLIVGYFLIRAAKKNPVDILKYE